MELAERYMREKKFDEAEKFIRKALKLYPTKGMEGKHFFYSRQNKSMLGRAAIMCSRFMFKFIDKFPKYFFDFDVALFKKNILKYLPLSIFFLFLRRDTGARVGSG